MRNFMIGAFLFLASASSYAEIYNNCFWFGGRGPIQATSKIHFVKEIRKLSSNNVLDLENFEIFPDEEVTVKTEVNPFNGRRELIRVTKFNGKSATLDRAYAFNEYECNLVVKRLVNLKNVASIKDIDTSKTRPVKIDGSSKKMVIIKNELVVYNGTEHIDVSGQTEEYYTTQRYQINPGTIIRFLENDISFDGECRGGIFEILTENNTLMRVYLSHDWFKISNTPTNNSQLFSHILEQGND